VLGNLGLVPFYKDVRRVIVKQQFPPKEKPLTTEQKKRLEELKRQAPYEEKIDTAHENYDYSYARINADDGYGTIEEQLEYIAENGVTAFKNKQAAVKTRYPKPE
jgi:hypothetical protein